MAGDFVFPAPPAHLKRFYLSFALCPQRTAFIMYDIAVKYYHAVLVDVR